MSRFSESVSRLSVSESRFSESVSRHSVSESRFNESLSRFIVAVSRFGVSVSRLELHLSEPGYRVQIYKPTFACNTSWNILSRIQNALRLLKYVYMAMQAVTALNRKDQK